MKSVQFHRLNHEGDQVPAGKILWDGKKFSTDPPDSPSMLEVLDEPANSKDGLISKDAGEAFLEALHHTYHGSTFWAEKPA